MEELKRRMEILLGTKPEAPSDESLKEQVEKEAQMLAKRDRVATAGWQLISAAFAFIGEMFTGREDSEETDRLAETFKKKLSEGLEEDENGQLRMTISFPNETALDNLAKSLARMVSFGG